MGPGGKQTLGQSRCWHGPALGYCGCSAGLATAWCSELTPSHPTSQTHLRSTLQIQTASPPQLSYPHTQPQGSFLPPKFSTESSTYTMPNVVGLVGS